MGKYWIFDFDGTLVDSEKPIKKCYEKVTKAIAPSRLKNAEEVLIGPTLQETTKLILGSENSNQHEKFIALFKKEYDENLLFETKPYLGVLETLQQLIQRGDKLAIATNKRKEPTLKIIERLNWGDYFNWVACLNSESKKIRNKSELVRSILANEIDFQESFFVGDTLNDALCAKENGLRFIKASYGYSEANGWDNFEIYQDISNPISILEI